MTLRFGFELVVLIFFSLLLSSSVPKDHNRHTYLKEFGGQTPVQRFCSWSLSVVEGPPEHMCRAADAVSLSGCEKLYVQETKLFKSNIFSTELWYRKWQVLWKGS